MKLRPILSELLGKLKGCPACNSGVPIWFQEREEIAQLVRVDLDRMQLVGVVGLEPAMKPRVGVLYNWIKRRICSSTGTPAPSISCRSFLDRSRSPIPGAAPPATPRAASKPDHLPRASRVALSADRPRRRPVDRERRLLRRRPHVLGLGRWRQRYGFLLVSEHLAAFRVRSAATVDHHSGLHILMLPWDDDVLAMLAERVAWSQDSLGAQLLLENGVAHHPGARQRHVQGGVHEPTADAPQRVRAPPDMDTLYVNSVNLGIDADAFLDELDLSTVREIHVAGGNELFGVYLDSHAGACPEPVWRLLARAAPRCRSLACVTFEFHESYYPRLGEAGILAEIARIRQTLREATGDEPCRSPSFNAPLPI